MCKLEDASRPTALASTDKARKQSSQDIHNVCRICCIAYTHTHTVAFVAFVALPARPCSSNILVAAATAAAARAATGDDNLRASEVCSTPLSNVACMCSTAYAPHSTCATSASKSREHIL